MSIGTEHHSLAARFIEFIGGIEEPHILEIGTRRSDPEMSTHHRGWFGAAGSYTMMDIAAGMDVDEVCDVESLPEEWDETQDAVICIATLEHVKHPWVAMEEMGYMLTPNGMLYVQTHQTFPLHGYPQDLWRFTRESLTLLAEDAGLIVVGTTYSYPCSIQPLVEMTRWNPTAEAFLCVDLLATRP